MDYSVYSLLGLFLVYSFLGWCVEVSFVAVTLGKVVNRGFLNGPVCPIYGVGMLGVLLLLRPVSGTVIPLFLGGMVLCSLVELIGGWALERIFHTRWWDYTDEPLNLGGYVCLRFSIMWGLAVVFAVRLIHPTVMLVLGVIPHGLGWALLGLFYALFLTDLVLTLVTIIGMKKRLGELERVGEALHTLGDTISDRVGNTALAADAKLDALKESGQVKVTEGKERMAAVIGSGQDKLGELKESGQVKVTEGKERMAAVIGSGQERLEDTLEELLERKRQLEARRQRLLAEYRSHPRFGVRRIGRAFPAIKQAVSEHLREMDEE